MYYYKILYIFIIYYYIKYYIFSVIKRGAIPAFLIKELLDKILYSPKTLLN